MLPLPLTDSATDRIATSVDYTFVSNATYNAAYDIWLDPTPRVTGQNTGAEIMVWANRQGSIQPIGSPVGTVQLDGATWEDVVRQHRMERGVISAHLARLLGQYLHR